MNKQNLPPEYQMGPVERDVALQYELQDMEVTVSQMENKFFENKYNVISRGLFVGEWDANNEPIYEGHTLKVGQHCNSIKVSDGERQVIAKPNQTCTITWSISLNRFICSTENGFISHEFWQWMHRQENQND
jgi:hypothetical protein